MVASIPTAEEDWAHRRMKINAASASPSSSASPPSRSSPPGSRCAIGPSTARCTTSGTQMLAPVAANAANSSQTS
ncbi:hypothetical protein GCM10027615_23760 [Plantactinospora veratri]